MRIRCCVTQIIDGNDLEATLLARFEHRPEYIAANPTETIDCYFDRHGLISLQFKNEKLRWAPASWQTALIE